MSKKLILDACCSGKCFWFDKNHPDVTYMDIREEEGGFIEARPNFTVKPDVIADFRDMPFADKTFKHVVFDPPHLLRGGLNGWQVQKYGKLNKETWKVDLLKGFNECLRVLDDYGTIVFKWNEYAISHKEVLSLFPIKPLYGHPTARSGKTKWWVYMKMPRDHNEEESK